MKKIYYLSSCDTCKRILNELKPLGDIELQDIKSDPITPEQLKVMRNLAGSYEALFSRRARLFSERQLKDRQLEEKDYEKLILEHYTFLKRPVILVNNQIFIGNSKKVVAKAKETIHS
ncbi:ArsC/Spx/MgsR family protein [uncultured Eudoraea sp.]|uniref:arsenate reductase family protein n=1 Tax=uncultured Eudoraea sp. TaxID=1035614 RepID=UPI002604C3FC|nr:ArsC/Spx/MgsR family protein [uncultured Eudoraea sp.]